MPGNVQQHVDACPQPFAFQIFLQFAQSVCGQHVAQRPDLVVGALVVNELFLIDVLAFDQRAVFYLSIPTCGMIFFVVFRHEGLQRFVGQMNPVVLRKFRRYDFQVFQSYQLAFLVIQVPFHLIYHVAFVGERHHQISVRDVFLVCDDMIQQSENQYPFHRVQVFGFISFTMSSSLFAAGIHHDETVFVQCQSLIFRAP